jgi:hypothetical protein
VVKSFELLDSFDNFVGDPRDHILLFARTLQQLLDVVLGALKEVQRAAIVDRLAFEDPEHVFKICFLCVDRDLIRLLLTCAVLL